MFAFFCFKYLILIKKMKSQKSHYIYILFCILFEIVISIFFGLGYLKNFTFITLTASFVFVMMSQIIVLKRKK